MLRKTLSTPNETAEAAPSGVRVKYFDYDDLTLEIPDSKWSVRFSIRKSGKHYDRFSQEPETYNAIKFMLKLGLVFEFIDINCPVNPSFKQRCPQGLASDLVERKVNYFEEASIRGINFLQAVGLLRFAAKQFINDRVSRVLNT